MENQKQDKASSQNRI